MARATSTTVMMTSFGSKCFNKGFDVSCWFGSAAIHQTVTILKAPYTSTDAAIDVMDAFFG